MSRGCLDGQVGPGAARVSRLSWIRDLLAFDGCEVMVNLAIKNLARFVEQPEFEPHLPVLFGSQLWRDAIALPLAERRTFLLRLYEEQLRTVAGFRYVRSFCVISESGQPSYYLVYATRHLRGLEVAKDAMWKVDPSGWYQFSTRYGSDVSLFVRDEVGTGGLERELKQQFAGKSVRVTRLEEFVLTDTDYRKAHLREALRAMERREEIIDVSGRKRRLTYPQRSVVRFAPGL